MKTMEANSIDFCITDPPYGLHFMGKDWDKFKNNRCKEDSGKFSKSMAGMAGKYDDKRGDEFQEFMRHVGVELLRILKPGGHIAMFGSPRRHHRQMCGLEDAGFEIRDVMMWIFGSGFPKSHNFGRQLGGDWAGYGTALKPSYEPIIIAMKPLAGTFAQNAEKWGVAGINIDAGRIPSNEKWSQQCHDITSGGLMDKKGRHERFSESHEEGRWPANCVFDEEAAKALDEMSEVNASRFFYCAKASTAERNEGLDKSNPHPTIKPLSLMRYLIKLFAPPGNPLLLDPFAGSGSTLVAAKQLGIRAMGIELLAEYCEIAEKRIAAAEVEDVNKIYEKVIE